MVTVRQGKEGQLDLPELPSRDANAESAQRAIQPSTAPAVSLQVVTEGIQTVRRHARTLTTLLDRPESLFDTRPPSFREVRAWHRQCAGHYSAALMRWPRRLWGLIHLFVILPVLRAAEWITGSPARLGVALGVAVAIWYWS